MILRKTITLMHKTFYVQIGLDYTESEALSPVEREAIKQNGEPAVNCGGNFGEDPVLFSLPSRELRFPSQFPVVQLFNTDDFEDAENRANLYKDVITARIATALADAKAYAADNGDSTGTWTETL